MAQSIVLKRSALSGKVPDTGSLSLGEVAINTYDGRVFFKKSGSTESVEHIVTTNSITTGSITLTKTGSFGELLVTQDANFQRDIFVTRDIVSNGDIDILGSFTASLANGYVWVGNGQNKTTLVATSSFGGSSTADVQLLISKTGSYATTGSNNFVGNQIIAGNLLPATSNSYDLGSTSSYWRDAYFESTGSINFVNNANEIVTTITSTTGGGIQIGNVVITTGSILFVDDQGNTTQTIAQSSSAGTISNFLTTSSFESYTSSVDSKITTLISKTGSYAITGSNNFIGNQTISGSLTVTQNLIVLGSSSIQNISASQLNIGTNLITVNSQTPSVRFGGFAVIDSGSSPQKSGSLLFDSVTNEWIFVHQALGSSITSSLLIMGPETYDDIGNEIHPTTNRLMKSIIDEHIGDSNITDTGTVVSINSNTEITGSLTMSGSSPIIANLLINPSGDVIIEAKSGSINTGSIELHGGLKWKRTANASPTEIGDLITFGGTMGLIEGGSLTTSSVGGRVVQAGEAVMYTMNTFPYGTHNLVKYDTIGSSDASRQITLPASSSVYVYYNNSGTLTYANTAPSSRSNIILGKVTTDENNIIYIDASQINAHHYSNYIDRLFREGIGPIFSSGGITTQGTISGSLNVTAATYFFSQNRITTNAGTNISMDTFYRSSISGQYVRTTGVTTINSSSYDNGSGTLVNIPSGKYAKHSLYLLGDNSLQSSATEAYMLVYGQSIYDTIGEAQAGSLPTPPSFFTDSISIIASIVVTPDSASIQSIIDERPRLGFISPSKTGVITAHGDLTGLTNDDHIQYLLIDGTRNMQGNLNLGTYNISNVSSISATSITGSIASTNGVVSGSSQIISILNPLNAHTGSINSYTASANNRLSSLESFTGSLDANYVNQIELETATGSLINSIATKLNTSSFETYTGSVDSKFSTLATTTASLLSETNNLELFTSSQNTKNTTLATYTSSIDTKFNSLSTYTSSVDTKFTTLQNITSSLNSYTASANNRLSSLESFTASLDITYVNQTELANATGSLINSIATKLNTSSFEAYTGSNDTTNTNQNSRLTNLETTSASINSSISNINSYTSSTNSRLSNIESFTASLDINYVNQTELASATGSLINSIATKLNTSSFQTYTSSVDSIVANVNSFTASAASRLINLESVSASLLSETNNLELFTSSQNTKNSTLQSYTSSIDTKFTTLATTTASLLIETSNLELFSASALSRFSNLESFTSSLDITYVNQTELANATGSLINSIATKLNTSSFESYTGSINTRLIAIENETNNLELFTSSIDTKFTTLQNITASLISNTGSYATTGSNNFIGNQRITGSLNVSGSVSEVVSTHTISTPFASGNYPLSLYDGVYTFNFGFYGSAVGGNRLSIYRNTSHTYFDNSSGNFYFNAPLIATSFSGQILATNGVVSGSSQVLDILTPLNLYTSSIDTKFATLATTTASLLIETSNLEIFSASALIRLNNLESFTSSLDTTYVNQTELANATGSLINSIATKLNTSSFNTYTSSNDTTNSNQNSRIDQLSVVSGSSISRLNNLESTSASVNVSISNINSYTSSLKTALSINGQDLTIFGNLTVQGDTTTLNTSNLLVEDKLIEIASGSTSSADANGAGIFISGANASILWDHTNQQLDINKSIDVAGNITLTGTVDGVDVSSFSSNINNFTSSQLSQNNTLGNYTSSIDTKFTTLQNVTSSVNSRLTNIESFTASIDNTYVNQTELANATGSLINSIATKLNTSSFQTYTSSTDSAIVNINSFTSSAASRLTNLESISASLLTETNNLELFTSSQNTKNTTIQSYTSSIDSKFTTLATTTASLLIETSNLEIFSASALIRLSNIETFTSSLDITYVNQTELANATGSLINSIATKLNTSSFETYTSSIDTKFTTLATYTGSIETKNNTLAIYTGSVDTKFTTLSNITSSLNSYTASANNRLSSLESFTASLDVTYVNQTELANATGSLINSIATKLNTSSFETYTSSTDSKITNLNSFTSSAASRLTNLESTSASLLIETSNLELFTSSQNTKNSTLATYTSSVDTKFTTLQSITSSILSYTSSQESKNTTLATYTGSVDTKWTTLSNVTASLNLYTSSQDTKNTTLSNYTSSLETKNSTLATYTSSIDTKFTTLQNVTSSLIAKTGSYATTSSNTFNGNQTISGSIYITGDLTVFGSSSIQTISSSIVKIGDNQIILNTFTPTVRFGGISVIDSGSINETGSLWWDSQRNHWLYEHPSSSTAPYNSAILIAGPYNNGTLGDEIGLTSNRLTLAVGEDHISSSQIYVDNTTVAIPANLQVTGSFDLRNAEFNATASNSSAGNVLVSSNPTGSYISAFYNYSISSGSNARAGQIMSVWNGNTLKYTEVTTTDIGSTTNVNFSASISSGNILLHLSSSGVWNVRSIVNLL